MPNSQANQLRIAPSSTAADREKSKQIKKKKNTEETKPKDEIRL